MVEDVSARILSRRCVVVFFIRGAIAPIRVTEGGCRLCLVSKAVARSRVFRRVRRLIVDRIVRPVDSGQRLRQDVGLLFALRAFLRVFAKVSCPAKSVSRYRGVLVRIFIPIRTIR